MQLDAEARVLLRETIDYLQAIGPMIEVHPAEIPIAVRHEEITNALRGALARTSG